MNKVLSREFYFMNFYSIYYFNQKYINNNNNTATKAFFLAFAKSENYRIHSMADLNKIVIFFYLLFLSENLII